MLRVSTRQIRSAINSYVSILRARYGLELRLRIVRATKIRPGLQHVYSHMHVMFGWRVLPVAEQMLAWSSRVVLAAANICGLCPIGCQQDLIDKQFGELKKQLGAAPRLPRAVWS